MLIHLCDRNPGLLFINIAVLILSDRFVSDRNRLVSLIVLFFSSPSIGGFL